MIPNPGAAAVIQPAAGWQTFRLLLLALVLLSSVNAGIGLVRTQWRRTLLPLVQATRALGLVWLYVVARSGSLVAAANTAGLPPGVDPTFVAHIVNAAIAYGVLLGLCFTVLHYGMGIARYLSRYIRQRGVTPAIHLANF